jgi:hypothetical protein
MMRRRAERRGAQQNHMRIPLTFKLISLNRPGREDLSPFIISPPLIEKFGFVHDLVRQVAGQGL